MFRRRIPDDGLLSRVGRWLDCQVMLVVLLNSSSGTYATDDALATECQIFHRILLRVPQSHSIQPRVHLSLLWPFVLTY